MSINSAMLAGVSGLTANSSALAAISQNIANVNTYGYKRSSAAFQTVINAQTAGSGYSAGGVMATARHYTSQLGQLQRTTSGTDLAIDAQALITGRVTGVEMYEGEPYLVVGGSVLPLTSVFALSQAETASNNTANANTNTSTQTQSNAS